MRRICRFNSHSNALVILKKLNKYYRGVQPKCQIATVESVIFVDRSTERENCKKKVGITSNSDLQTEERKGRPSRSIAG